MGPIFLGYRRRKHVVDILRRDGGTTDSSRDSRTRFIVLPEKIQLSWIFIALAACKTISLFFFGLASRPSRPSHLRLSSPTRLPLFSMMCASTNEGVMYFHVQKLGQTLDSLIKILLQEGDYFHNHVNKILTVYIAHYTCLLFID